mgnify:CR=1 FL=1
MDLDEFDPRIKQGILEGRIDPADAKWLNEYAKTPGNSQVETGRQYKDISEKMENYMNRIKSGEVTGQGFKDKILELRGRGGGSGAGVDIEGIPMRLRPSGGKKFKKGGKIKSASARADGIAQRGKTRGKVI